ncbi:MAG: TIGR03936 family radical SAM-associated protein, partial [Treponema sp.]|nr:TIGR03936 family radical SAM-associated protein [Treponema sp.]
LAGQFLAASEPDAPLPWQDIASGVAPGYLRAEFAKSAKGELSPTCASNCAARCGICGDTVKITHNKTPPPAPPSAHAAPSLPDPAIWRLLFSFTKEGGAVFHGHLSLIEIFSMAMGRAGIDVLYTQGFNPLAKLEIVSPLSIGISAGAEIAAADFSRETPPGEFLAKMNAALPEGIKVNRAEIFCIPAGSKKRSLSSLLWGFGYAKFGYAQLGYADPTGETVYIPAADEKAWRKERFAAGETAFSLRRACVLAKNTPDDPSGGGGQPWTSYFNAYQNLYGCKKIPDMV